VYGKYANPGETGGNYEGVEDYSGSSYVSSASKRNLMRQGGRDEEGRLVNQLPFQNHGSLMPNMPAFVNS
jgi:hypothetical protein